MGEHASGQGLGHGAGDASKVGVLFTSINGPGGAPELLNFYRANYDPLFGDVGSSGSRRTAVIIGSRSSRKCRFCGRTDAEASFRSTAHAVAALTGNSVLFTNEECDECNGRFGRLEDDLGKFTQPIRTFAQVGGRKGIPGIKLPSMEIRVKAGDIHAYVDREETRQTFVDDEKTKRLTITVALQPFRPRAVYKAFVKMALSVVPIDEVCSFNAALQWLASDSLTDGATSGPGGYLCVETQSRRIWPAPTVFVLRRKPQSTAPYATLFVAFANATFQIWIPAGEMDQGPARSDLPLHSYPPPSLLSNSPDDFTIASVWDLSSPDLVRDASRRQTFSYAKRERVST